MNQADATSNNLSETLKLLRCTICNQILSVPPILTISDNEYQCGRCKDIKYSEDTIRNIIFERVGKYLNFPCVNPNCEALVPWDDVETHEKDCSFQTITCPMFQDGCNEQININELTLHMIQKHGNNILFEKIFITVAMFKPHVCVASVNSVVFLIYICSDKVLVTSVKPSNNTFSYTLKLCSNDTNSTSIFYENQPIETFNERKHCFRCLDKRCDLKCHPYSKFNQPQTEDSGTSVKPNDESPRSVDILKKAGYARTPVYKNISLAAPATSKVARFGAGSSDTVELFGSSSTLNSFSFGEVLQKRPVDSQISPLNANAPTFVFQPVSSASNRNDVPTNNEVKDKNVKSVMKSNGKSENTDKSENGLIKVKEFKCTKFNLPHIHNLIGVTSSITFTITIRSNDEIEQDCSVLPDSFIPRNLLSTIDNSEVLRKTLECPICTEYMIDSIFVCERGHHICKKCRMVTTCPTCQGIIAESRNFALENIAEGISLCCIFKEYGCEFRGNLKTISEHEKNCLSHQDDAI